MKTLILLPAFNEAGNIGSVLDAIIEQYPRLPVLVVDDGSTDGTAAEVEKRKVRMLTHPFNLGYGAALQTGFTYALKEGFECVVQVDADGQHEPRSLGDLVAALQGGEADIVVGSRFLEPTGYTLSPARMAGIILFRSLASLFTGRKITDATSGYQALGTRALELYTGEEYPADYPDADVLIMAHRAGLRITEIPVMMYPDDGKSRSMHGGLKPVYYVGKMFLSIAALLLRRPAPGRRGG